MERADASVQFADEVRFRAPRPVVQVFLGQAQDRHAARVPWLEFVSKSLRTDLASRVSVERQDHVIGAGEFRDASRESTVG
jgi:hypothetical protein